MLTQLNYQNTKCSVWSRYLKTNLKDIAEKIVFWSIEIESHCKIEYERELDLIKS